jgi:hypothetical protein
VRVEAGQELADLLPGLPAAAVVADAGDDGVLVHVQPGAERVHGVHGRSSG